ncbi:anthranilate synthase component I family protein [Georgenia sp. MJ170]|uniref:anthranilate synthase component I family protein n=1 Tax=Georgenia sunbinii TaxID=3117728 RepID=UPI002F266768
MLESGWWAVVATFEGAITGWRFAEVESDAQNYTSVTLDTTAEPERVAPWQGPSAGSWQSSLDEDAYVAAVEATRRAIRDGDVYQANICRILSAPLDTGGDEPDAAALARLLAAGNPAPHAGAIHVPASTGLTPAWVVSASPELFLSVAGDRVLTGPIKGTGATAADLREKDRAENVMITDLMRNDLQRVSLPGTVEVIDLCVVEHHPGLVHLVSRVGATLRESGTAAAWQSLLAATLPPGSVSGAPKSSALQLIAELETAPRGPYCGAVGWIDADAGRAELAVGIRTFWWTRDAPGTGTLRFGTGAGITWGSEPAAEWRETELKAARLVALASGAAPVHRRGRLVP